MAERAASLRAQNDGSRLDGLRLTQESFPSHGIPTAMPSDEDSEQYQLATARVGTTIRDKYRLDKVLGMGGMAVVYSATHRNQKQFAVKMLHPELSFRQDVRTRFLREGYAANSFKHPGAVAVLDDDVAEDGAAFLVMELLEGDELEHLAETNGGRLPVQAVLAVGYQLLDVLAAAHEKGLVHRDIKPPNLFLTDDGTVKVLDFGIARVRDALADGSRGTAAGTLLGTPGFMPPEQALGKSDEIDGQSDVWSAGATLFSLLTGQSTHPGDNSAQLMVAAATQPARKIQSLAPHVPDAVAQIIDRALEFQKSSRWPDASAMRDAIAETYAVTCGEPVAREPLIRLIQGLKPRLASPAAGDAKAPSRPADRRSPTVEEGAIISPPSRAQAVPVPTIGGQTSVAAFQVPGLSRRKQAERIAMGFLAIALLAIGAFALRSTSSSMSPGLSTDSRTAAARPAPRAVPVPAPETSALPTPGAISADRPWNPTPLASTISALPSPTPAAVVEPARRPTRPQVVPAVAPTPAIVPVLPSAPLPSPAALPAAAKAAAAPCKLVETLDKAGESHFTCPCAKCE